MGHKPEIENAARKGMPNVRDRLPELSRAGSNKVTGQTIEVLFKYHCMKRGLIPHTPEGDPPCHDMAVFNSQTGKIRTVQVKSTSSFKSSNNKGDQVYPRKGNYKIKAKCLGDKIDLKDTYVDTLVIYIPPHNTWYIIPVYKITASVINLFPHINNSRGKYEKYKDNWKAFGKTV
tara:strand:- start:77 stop:601 length:525 start_codon:yes stop_codon:yes gene_type:complete